METLCYKLRLLSHLLLDLPELWQCQALQAGLGLVNVGVKHGQRQWDRKGRTQWAAVSKFVDLWQLICMYEYFYPLT